MWRICILSGALVCLGAGGEQETARSKSANTKPNGLVTVSLTFDDTHANQWNAVTIMEKYNMHGTFYVNSPRIGRPNYLTRANLDAMHARGHEIGGHTLTHRADLEEEKDINVVIHEICDDKQNLTNLGYKVNSFAYPRGESGGYVTEVAKKCYASAREVGGISASHPTETIPPRDPHAIRTPSSINKPACVAELKVYVLAAQRTGGWLPLIFHHISDGGEDYSITPAMFEEFLQWLSTERDAGRVVVKTVHDVLTSSVRR
jgi:peptidoglycan/xylan/chitin deacetylase (PgdA/CDA1 family)